jgi:hypothetical protein
MVSYDYAEDRINSLENDRKQLQLKLENLEYAMTLLESQLKHDYVKHHKELDENVYYIVMVTLLGIVIFMLCLIYK